MPSFSSFEWAVLCILVGGFFFIGQKLSIISKQLESFIKLRFPRIFDE
jgi:hypothetical protein